MAWSPSCIWSPAISASGCTHCGTCYASCPQSPEVIVEYAAQAAVDGERYGLKNADHFISFDLDTDSRVKSSSGGVVSLLLTRLLESHDIDGVLCSTPLCAGVGAPHYKLDVMTTAGQIHGCRSSHYHPLTYHEAFKHIKNSGGAYAVVGVPCVIRGIKLLPPALRKKIKYTIALACSHNVTAAFIDQLALQQGITKKEIFSVNLREKLNISDASNFNTFFKLSDREIRKNRFLTSFTVMWRNYFFALESCLYCPDFYGADGDLSVKDAWGRLSKDPLGTSLLIVRNSALLAFIEKLSHAGLLHLEPCDEDEICKSQPESAAFKQTEVHTRLLWKKAVKNILKKTGPIPAAAWLISNRQTWRYFRILGLIKISNFCFARFGSVPVKSILFCSTLDKQTIALLQVCRRAAHTFCRTLRISPEVSDQNGPSLSGRLRSKTSG